MIEIDGSAGEGGGQILRSALTLSLATGQPLRLVNIRARRSRPGLQRQHLAAVRAAAEIGRAELDGDGLNSRELTFRPAEVTPGAYRFAIGSAGSTMLVLQTVLPVLLTASGPSMLRLEGGTHNHFAPPFEFIEQTFVPLLNQLGCRVEVELERPGYYPAGGGAVRIDVQPAGELAPLELMERGPIRGVRARAVVARLPRHIAEREVKVVARKLGLGGKSLEVVEETRSLGPGNVVNVEIESDALTEVVTGFGEKGVPAEKVANRTAREAKAYLEAGVPVGEHLADQLLVPLATGSGGRFVTMPISTHTETNIGVIHQFGLAKIDVQPADPERTIVTVRTGG